MKFYCMPSATHCSGIQMPMATFPGWVKYKDGDPLKGTSYEVSYEIPEGFFDNFA